MRIKEIVAISGMGGLYKSETQKVNGLIVTSLTEGWTKFVSNRQHLFSPLENVSIYTDGDPVELAEVILEIYKQKETNPPVDANASNDILREWFTKIVPNHDREKVYTSDIKKLIKWYFILDKKGIIADEIKAREEEKVKEAELKKDTIEEKEDTQAADAKQKEKKKKAE